MARSTGSCYGRSRYRPRRRRDVARAPTARQILRTGYRHTYQRNHPGCAPDDLILCPNWQGKARNMNTPALLEQPTQASPATSNGRHSPSPPRAVRNRLPDERISVTHKFEVGGNEGYLTVG